MKNFLKFVLLKYWIQLKKNTRKQLMNENDQIFNQKSFLYFFAFVAADRLWGNWNIRFDWLLCKSFLLFFCSISFEKRNLPLRQAWGLSGQRPRNKNNQHRIKYHPNPVGGAFDWARTRVVPVRVCSPVRSYIVLSWPLLWMHFGIFCCCDYWQRVIYWHCVEAPEGKVYKKSFPVSATKRNSHRPFDNRCAKEY